MARVAILQVVPILLILSVSCAASGRVVSPKALQSLQFVLNKCNSLSKRAPKVYVEFCVQTLTPRAPLIAENDVRLAQSALGVDLSYAKKAETSALQVIHEKGVQAKEKEAVNLCLSGIKEVLSTVNKTSRELQKPSAVLGQHNDKINQSLEKCFGKINKSLEKCSGKMVTPSIKKLIDEVHKATTVVYLLYH